MRKTTGILLASGIVLSLAACAAPTGPALDGASPVDPASCSPTWQRGGLADDVTADGDFGTTPVTIDFPKPLVSKDATSTAVLDEGEGALIPAGSIVAGTMTMFDGTGQLLTQTNASTRIPLGSESSPFFDSAVCARIGSRIAAVGPASQLLGEAFVSQYQLDPEMTIVSVLDIQDAYLSRAQGTPQSPQNGLPTVSLTSDGQPGLSFTNAEAPTDLRIETLIAGSGTTVADGDTVLVQYTGVIWDSHEVFDSSWESGSPAALPTTGVVDGLAKALVGQTVGSQVLASIPPDQGYGDSPPDGSGISATDTLVFVVDILGVIPATQ